MSWSGYCKPRERWFEGRRCAAWRNMQVVASSHARPRAVPTQSGGRGPRAVQPSATFLRAAVVGDWRRHAEWCFECPHGPAGILAWPCDGCTCPSQVTSPALAVPSWLSPWTGLRRPKLPDELQPEEHTPHHNLTADEPGPWAWASLCPWLGWELELRGGLSFHTCDPPHEAARSPSLADPRSGMTPGCATAALEVPLPEGRTHFQGGGEALGR